MIPEDVNPFELLVGDVRDSIGELLPRPAVSHLIDTDVITPTREIFIGEEISEDFGGWFTKVFRYLLLLNHDPITVWLNTPGGDEESSLVFHDLVITSPAKVTIVGTGSICSAGVLMLACGHHRFVTENCVLMSHESRSSGESSLRHSEAKERRKWEDWMHSRWFELMGRCTSPHNPERDAAFWKRKTEGKAEYWLLGAQAIIADGIADATYDPEALPFTHLISRGEGS